MAQLQRAEGQIEIKSQADEFFNLWIRNTNLISEWCPDKYPKIELNEGTSWHSIDAVTTWHFRANGCYDFVKTKVTEVDEKDKCVSYNYIEGHGRLRSYYKSFKTKFQAIPKRENKGCIVKWTFEYEKKNENAPDANLYINFLLDCAKYMDARLCSA